MNTKEKVTAGEKTPDIEIVIDEHSNKTKKWKRVVIGVICLLTLFSVWAGYLIVNGSLSFIKSPLSKNILNDKPILCILWFVGVFIALAYKLGILGFNQESKKEEVKTEDETEKKEVSTVLKKYIIPGLTIFIIVPVVSAVVLYYIIYFIVFLFLGILPYLVGITMIAGLALSLIQLPKFVYKPKRGKKILVFSMLMILCYALTIFLMYEFDAKVKNYKPIDPQEIIAK